MGILKREANGRISSFVEKPRDIETQNKFISRDDAERPFLGSMGIYMFKTKVLMELLADFQITVPEFGTIRASVKPVVILTSNRTREVHDAIRRRCLYHWVAYPDAARERAILAAKAPGVPLKLAEQVVAFLQFEQILAS